MKFNFFIRYRINGVQKTAKTTYRLTIYLSSDLASPPDADDHPHAIQAYARPQIIQNITAFLYAFLLRFCISETHEAPAFSHFIFTDAYSAITRKTIAYLEQYFSNSFSLDSLSEYINYNKSYLCTVFKRETGYSIIEYLTFVRIRNAVISFIFYGDTISSVRESSGFVSAVHFGRVFKELLGVTPREFRSVFQSLSSRDVASIFPKNPIVNYHISSLEEAMDALRSIGETVILRLDAGKKAAGSESCL